MVVTGIFLLILANIGFEAGLVFYDAFLPEITSERSYGRVSGYGFALGYVGSLASLATVFPLYAGGFGPGNLMNIRFSFIIAAAFFLVFALPLFFFLPDKQRTKKLTARFYSSRLCTAQEHLCAVPPVPQHCTLSDFLLYLHRWRQHHYRIFLHLRARNAQDEHERNCRLFCDGPIFCHRGICHVRYPGRPYNAQKDIEHHLAALVDIVVIAYFIQDKWMFYGLGVLAGLALGSSQSTSRGMMSIITPQDKKTEFFGFYSFFGKASAVLGPVVFGFVSSFLNQRFAILSIGFFLLTGLILLQRVEECAAESAAPLS